MITRADIETELSSGRLREIQSSIAYWNVNGIRIDDEEYPLIRLRAVVEGRYYYRVPVDVTIDDYRKCVYRGRLTDLSGIRTPISALRYEELCLVYFFVTQREWGNIPSANKHFKTSSALTQFMTFDAEQGHLLPDTSANVYLHAIYVANSYQSQMHLEFRIGRQGQRSYVVQNLHALCQSCRNNERVHFGKALDFIVSKESFDTVSRQILAFLMRLDEGNDQFVQKEDYYDTRSYIGRTLTLSGTYLDEMMDLLDEEHFYLASDTHGSEMHCVDGLSNISAKIEPLEDDYIFSMTAPNLYEGERFLYEVDETNCEMRRISKTPAAAEVVALSRKVGSSALYLSQEDIPAFSTTLYPKLKEVAKLEITGFDPEMCVPPMPQFEMYLDYPQEDFVTCELKSVYGEETYNVLKGYTEHPERRNLREEKRMDQTLFTWFNSFDPQNARMVCAKDDEKLYLLLTEGIPFFQTLGEVYVSQRLKKLNATAMSRVSVGISVKNDLLQLHLVEDSKSLEELAEILSRYEPKKKYYKLKNGNLVKVDEKNVKEIASLVEDLQLSNKDIKSGEITVPKYRAMYLDAIEEEELELERDQHFTQLIAQVHDIEHTVYEIPPSLENILRDYQKEGFRWLKALQQNGFGGLLADEMGLGKSIQIIALIQSMQKRGRVLIVCPASLVYNWKNEFEKFAPHLAVTMLSGSAKERLIQIEESAEDAIFVTSYDALKRDVDAYDKLVFDLEVIDEAQYIKNAGTQAAGAVKQIHAKCKIALTGTPIENRLAELWSIFDYMMSGYLYSYPKFKKLFETPIVKKQNREMQEKLRKMIMPFILRRKKMDVLKDLPEKLEEVMFAPLDGEQKDLYTARTQRLKAMLQSQTQKEFNENRIAVLAEITKLRQTCCAPALLYEAYKGNSNKEALCMDLIQRAIEEGHKILLFSQFRTMLERLCAQMEQEGIAYHLLTGSTSKEKRASLVEQFQKDEVPVFCISLKAGGTGLNLTAADVVIHYDPWWNTAVENQASDRAHRIGQDKPVTVYKLILKDTIEERIVALQETKANLEKEILSGEEIADSTLTKEQLMQILE